MTSRARLSALARPLGWVLVALSAIFLFLMAREHWASLSEIRLGTAQWTVLAMLALAYGASLFLLAAGWHVLIGDASDTPVDPMLSLRAYGTSQLAKYVPGNVFHLVGRHMLHRQAGTGDGALARAALAEIVLMVSSAVTVGALFALGALADADLEARMLPLLAGILAGAFGIVIAVRFAAIDCKCAGQVFALHLLFFLVLAGAFAAVLATLGERLSLAGAAIGVVGWIAGFVTPGASGGIGVREAALVFLGENRIGTETMLVAAALFRAVTFAGDLVCFAIARALPAPRSVTAA